MTRYTFGSSAADYVIQAPSLYAGQLMSAPNRSGTAWSAISGGTEYTDLIAIEGTTAPSTDANGWINRFQGPDGVDRLWLQFSGSTDRFLIIATDAPSGGGGGGGGGGADLDSPAFTGTPTAPTAVGGTNTTQLATTAFVQSAAAAKQPLDTDLTQIAALATTAFGRARLTDADAVAARSALALGSVDNTSDSAKPISTATQTALNLRMVRVRWDGTGSQPARPVTPAGVECIWICPTAPTGGGTVGGGAGSVNGLDIWWRTA